jgi:hypothetical protein
MSSASCVRNVAHSYEGTAEMFYRLLIERCIRSACGAFFASLAAGAATVMSVPTAKAALIAAGAAAVSAVITIISQAFGDPTSTSFLKNAPGADR